MITSKTPKLDLHGEVSAMVEVLVNIFIKEQVLLNNLKVIIIHGKSSRILKDTVHDVLKSNANVISYKQDNWNLGQTIVTLKGLK